MLRAVVFDMDGVLLDTERVGVISWTHAASLQGKELTPAVYKGMIGLSHIGSREHLRQHGWEDPGIQQMETAAWSHYLALLERDGVPHKRGVFELLDFLDKKGILTGVATSTRTEIAQRQLDRMGVGHRFHVIIGGDQVTQGKPAPDIYLRAAERLGYSPEECVAVEDSGPGIRAAAASGMKVVWIPDICDVDSDIQRLIYATLPSLAEMAPVIEQLADWS